MIHFLKISIRHIIFSNENNFIFTLFHRMNNYWIIFLLICSICRWISAEKIFYFNRWANQTCDYSRYYRIENDWCAVIPGVVLSWNTLCVTCQVIDFSSDFGNYLIKKHFPRNSDTIYYCAFIFCRLGSNEMYFDIQFCYFL